MWDIANGKRRESRYRLRLVSAIGAGVALCCAVPIFAQNSPPQSTGNEGQAAIGAQTPALFHLAWQLTLQDLPRRIAVADIKGDGKARFITLNEKPGDQTASTLAVKRWNGKDFDTEYTANVQGPADKLEVGKFAGSNRPAVIVTAADLWYWTGSAFAHKPFAQQQNLFGATRLRDGTERVLIAHSPTDVKAYRINLNAQADDLLTDGIPAPKSNLAWGDMHAAPDFLEKMGMPSWASSGGLIGVWEVHKLNRMFLYHPNQDYDIVPDPKDPNKPKFIPKGDASTVAFIGTTPDSSGQIHPYLTSNLAGVVYDIALQSPKGDGVAGLLILTSTSAEGKGRSLYFFALN